MAFPFGRSEVIGSSAKDAFYLGRFYDEQMHQVGPKMQMGGTEPIVVVGRNRSGKDAGIGNYNLLQHEGQSWFVNDPRCEAAAICGPYRATLGPTYSMNAYGLLTHLPGYEDLKSTGWAPLAGLSPNDPMLFDHVAAICEALIRLEEKAPHWTHRARALWGGLTIEEIHEAAKAGRVPLLANVRAALTEGDEYDGAGEPIKGLVARSRRLMGKISPQVDSLLGSFTVDNDETRSVRATADGQTLSLLSQPIRDEEIRNGLRLEVLGDQPVTVFFSMPHEMVQADSIHSSYLRLVISSALRSLYRPSNTVCNFWLNEFAAIGRLGAVEASIGLVAGYGIRTIIVVQSLANLHHLYADAWESFLGNAAAVVLIGPPADKFTAEYLSSRSGETTIAQPNVGLQLNSSGIGLSNGEAYTRRGALMPQDLYGLQPGHGYVWVAGLSNAIPAYFPPYWDVERLERRARRNPYYRG
jgi:type IV secretion system protein VirD4